MVLVLPGGSYETHSPSEGIEIAHWLSAIGCHAVVLFYPVAPNRYPSSLIAARKTLDWIRHGGTGLNIKTNAIGLLGSSAGGHLAACVATGIDDPESLRPNFAIYCYPVVSLITDAHENSITNLLGSSATRQLRRHLSAERHVDEKSPPSFIWLTGEDAEVSPRHGLDFATALLRAGVPTELHVFPRGDHGLGLAKGQSRARHWTALCRDWLHDGEWLPNTSSTSLNNY